MTTSKTVEQPESRRLLDRLVRLPVSELLRRACIYAEQDRSSLIEAMSGLNDSEDREFVNEQKSFLRQLRDYRRKRWGKSGEDKLSEMIAQSPEVEIG